MTVRRRKVGGPIRRREWLNIQVDGADPEGETKAILGMVGPGTDLLSRLEGVRSRCVGMLDCAEPEPMTASWYAREITTEIDLLERRIKADHALSAAEVGIRLGMLIVEAGTRSWEPDVVTGRGVRAGGRAGGKATREQSERSVLHDEWVREAAELAVRGMKNKSEQARRIAARYSVVPETVRSVLYRKK